MDLYTWCRTPCSNQRPGRAEIGLLHLDQCLLIDSIIVLCGTAPLFKKRQTRLKHVPGIFIKVLPEGERGKRHNDKKSCYYPGRTRAAGNKLAVSDEL